MDPDASLLPGIDDNLRALVTRRNAARAARARRQGDADRARADIESYRRQTAQLTTAINDLLEQRVLPLDRR